jgi:hypothetical protein
MVICNDADRAATSGHGVGTRAAIQSFFESLAQRGDDTILSLVVAYAQQDAAAAFRVSKLLWIDLIDKIANGYRSKLRPATVSSVSAGACEPGSSTLCSMVMCHC